MNFNCHKLQFHFWASDLHLFHFYLNLSIYLFTAFCFILFPYLLTSFLFPPYSYTHTLSHTHTHMHTHTHTLSHTHTHMHTHTHHSSINRPPIMRLYRLPSASILHTTQLKKCVCVLLSVVFDSLVTDSNLITMIEYLPPPVIEVNIVTSHIIFWFLFKYFFSN